MKRLGGKIVVVTGAARGQGAAIAARVAAEGARVIALDVEEPDAPPPPTIMFSRHDVRDEAQWGVLATRLRSEYGYVDGLVNNAGVTWRARLADVTTDDAHRVFDINATGTLIAMKTMAPLMPRGGSIVNVGSVAALTAHYPVAYAGSKWAVRGMSKVASMELGAQGIRVNVVHPGFIETPMTASAPPSFREANIAQTPLGRTGQVEEVAALVAFLLSDESSFISGAEIPIDGGMSAHGGAKAIADAMFGGDVLPEVS